MFQYLNKHKELVPLFVICGAGCVGATYYLLRLATKNPDCSWDRKNNPHPWQKIRHDQIVKYVNNQPKTAFRDDRPKF
eukprot:m.306765 g.306765  ORF g.306765 m.306765 type:complete len:78 (+) comp41571_c0_seq1:68-301(+)